MGPAVVEPIVGFLLLLQESLDFLPSRFTFNLSKNSHQNQRDSSLSPTKLLLQISYTCEIMYIFAQNFQNVK